MFSCSSDQNLSHSLLLQKNWSNLCFFLFLQISFSLIVVGRILYIKSLPGNPDNFCCTPSQFDQFEFEKYDQSYGFFLKVFNRTHQISIEIELANLFFIRVEQLFLNDVQICFARNNNKRRKLKLVGPRGDTESGQTFLQL